MIVGIGELLWDVYPDGHKVAGGAPFNFAFHCQQLGHPSAIVSRVGDDELGRELREEVRKLGVSDEFVQTDPVHPTGTVRVAVDADGQPTYTIADDVAWDHIEWESGLEYARHAQCVYFGTLAQRSPVTRETIFRLVGESRWQRPSGFRVLDLNFRSMPAEPWPVVRSLLAANWVKVSESELEQVAALTDILSTDLPGYPSDTRERPVWIITAGANMGWVHSPELIFAVYPVRSRVVDTVGAGDAFLAAFVCMRLERRSFQDCARFASHYAARVCEHRGATPRIDRAEVERAAFGGHP